MKALTNASSSRGSYVPQKLKTFLKTKISHPVFGSQRVQDALKKPDIEQKKLVEIFKKAKEEGVLRQTSSTKSENEFYKSAAKEERLSRQLDQKNQEIVQKTVKPKDEKALNIAQAQRETAKAKRGLELRLGGKLGQVIEEQSKFRKTWGKSADLGVKSRGGVPIEEKSTGLLNKVMQEEKGDSSSKSGKKNGDNASANKKSGGSQPVKLQGSVGIEKLTHSPEISNENITGGVYHVKGLDKLPESRSEAPQSDKTAPSPAPSDIDDLNIG